MTARSPESTPIEYKKLEQFDKAINRALESLSENKRSRAQAAIAIGQMRTHVKDVGGIFGEQEGSRVLVIALHGIFSDNGFPEEPTVHFAFEDMHGSGDSSERRSSASWEDTARDVLRRDDFEGKIPPARNAIDALSQAVKTLRRIDGISTQGAADIAVAVLDRETTPLTSSPYTFRAIVEASPFVKD